MSTDELVRPWFKKRLDRMEHACTLARLRLLPQAKYLYDVWAFMAEIYGSIREEAQLSRSERKNVLRGIHEFTIAVAAIEARAKSEKNFKQQEKRAQAIQERRRSLYWIQSYINTPRVVEAVAKPLMAVAAE